MPNLTELRNEHRALKSEANTLIAKGEDATPEEATRANEIVKEKLPALKSSIDAIAGMSSLKADLDADDRWDKAPVNKLPQQRSIKSEGSAGRTEINMETGEIVDESGAGILSTSAIKAIANPEYLSAYGDFFRAGGKLESVKSADARKSLSEGIDTDGGFTVPPEMLAGIIRKEPAPTKLQDFVRTITVSSDRAMMLKSVYGADDLYSSAVRVYKTAEGAAATKTDQPVFGTFTIDVHQFTAELSISRVLLEDSAFNIVAFMTEEFRIAYRNFRATKILTGSGVGEHAGILTRAGTDNGPGIVKTGAAAGVTWQGLRKIKNAVPEQYDENCYYVFNKKSTQDAIEDLVDNNGRPLWPEAQRAGLQNGTPGSLQGYSYLREAFMPDIAAGNKPYFFGDPRGYMVAQRLGMTVEPLREIEARRGQVVFLARFREGGDVAEPWRIKVGQCAG